MTLPTNGPAVHQEYYNGQLTISTDTARLDIDAVHRFLSQSYWAEGIPRDIVARSVRNSLCFGVYDGAAQIGFARVISDYATYAYLADVYVIDSYRGKGIGTWLMSCIIAHPDLQGLRRWSLLTRDAHGLYEKSGFAPPKNPGRHMELHNPDVYKNRPHTQE
jgi:GNAT superfamily N-acetyltransferase